MSPIPTNHTLATDFNTNLNTNIPTFLCNKINIGIEDSLYWVLPTVVNCSIVLHYSLKSPDHNPPPESPDRPQCWLWLTLTLSHFTGPESRRLDTQRADTPTPYGRLAPTQNMLKRKLHSCFQEDQLWIIMTQMMITSLSDKLNFFYPPTQCWKCLFIIPMIGSFGSAC